MSKKLKKVCLDSNVIMDMYAIFTSEKDSKSAGLANSKKGYRMSSARVDCSKILMQIIELHSKGELDSIQKQYNFSFMVTTETLQELSKGITAGYIDGNVFNFLRGLEVSTVDEFKAQTNEYQIVYNALSGIPSKVFKYDIFGSESEMDKRIMTRAGINNMILLTSNTEDFISTGKENELDISKEITARLKRCGYDSVPMLPGKFLEVYFPDLLPQSFTRLTSNRSSDVGAMLVQRLKNGEFDTSYRSSHRVGNNNTDINYNHEVEQIPHNHEEMSD